MRYYSLLRVGINMQANFGEKEVQMRSTERLAGLATVKLSETY